ncbi:hypothetical protein D3C86_2196140 [compost metagenome]
MEIGNVNRRNEIVVTQAIGVKTDKTIDTPEIHLPVGRLKTGVIAELAARKTVENVVISESPGHEVKFGNALIGTQP